jgi:hypothetical protein
MPNREEKYYNLFKDVLSQILKKCDRYLRNPNFVIKENQEGVEEDLRALHSLVSQNCEEGRIT